MPEYSSNTLIPTDATKVPGMQGSNAGNFQLDALKAYILAEKAQANGLASLDADGKLNSSQIPANLDDVLVYASYASLPATGETGKLYITSDVNGTYYWNGTSYQILNQSFVRYRGSVSSLPSDPQPGDWFIAASSFSSYTSGHIYLYNGSSWDDVTAVFGQFVLKTDIAQTIGPEIDKVPSNAAVNGAINAIMTLLWDNEHPTSAFAPQTVHVNFSKYKFVGILCSIATSSNHGQQMFIARPTTSNTYVYMSIIDDTSADVYKRVATLAGGKGSIGFDVGRVNQTQNNSACIPQAIYGLG